MNAVCANRCSSQPVSAEAARDHLAEKVASGKVIGIGSPRASLEANFALRTLVGPGRFHTGMADNEAKLAARLIEILQRGPMRTPTLREIEECDAVFILGEDLTSAMVRARRAHEALLATDDAAEARAAYHAHRKPIWRDQCGRLAGREGPLYVATPYATRLDEIATATFRGAPDDLARLGFAVQCARPACAFDGPFSAGG